MGLPLIREALEIGLQAWRATEARSKFHAAFEELDRLESALRIIGTPEHVPQGFDPLDWWRHTACKRGEIARDALGVTAEELVADQWEQTANG